ncbi:MAG: hypothetical protein AAGK21_10850 [Bacteroidota bacterium]
MRLLLLLLLLASAAAAQPNGDDLLNAWRASWRSASADVNAITVGEAMDVRFEGPRGDSRIEANSTVRYDLGSAPRREVRDARVNGVQARQERGPRFERRLVRALGPPGREVMSPPALPNQLLRSARARRVAADRVDGVSAWRVTLDNPGPVFAEATVWLTRSTTPRLLRARGEGTRPRGGRFTRDVRYVRLSGLDLPLRVESTFVTRQRRRLRSYVVSLRAETSYDDFVVR